MGVLVVTKVSLVGQSFIDLKEAPDTAIDHKIVIQKLIKYCLNLNSISLFMCYHLLPSNVESMAIYPLLVKLQTVFLKVLYLDHLFFVYLEMRNVFFSVSETSGSDEKTRLLPTDQSRTYDLLITSPDSVALLLSFRRSVGAKGH